MELNSCEGTHHSQFNGGYCKVSDQAITKTFHDLPAHSYVKLSAVIHAFDDWQGEKLFVQVNGNKGKDRISDK